MTELESIRKQIKTLDQKVNRLADKACRYEEAGKGNVFLYSEINSLTTQIADLIERRKILKNNGETP